MVDIVTLMEILYEDEIPEMISAQIHAAKSFYDPENSATCPNALSGGLTLGKVLEAKSGLQQSLAHFNQPLLNSNTSQESGKRIAKRNDFWESP